MGLPVRKSRSETLAAIAPGLGAVAILILLFGGAFAALMINGQGSDRRPFLDPYTWSLIRFSAWQAFLSTVLSVLGAIPLARALARRNTFPGRAALIRLIGLPMVIPVLVGVLGIVAVAGRGGWISAGWQSATGSAWPSIFGLSGILIAHVFFNLPLITRVLLGAWSGVPGETWRLCSQLGMNSGTIFRMIEIPLLRRTLPPIAALSFLLCFTSFAIVLTLGGGPPRATLEVAIYQALRFDFDLHRASGLAAVQMVLAGLVLVAALAAGRRLPLAGGLDLTFPRPDRDRIACRVIDASFIAGISLCLAAPILAVIVNGLKGPVLLVLLDPNVWAAAGRSVFVALASASTALCLGWALVLAARRSRLRLLRPRLADFFEVGGSMTLVVPALAVGAGWFIALRPWVDPFALALPMTIIVNAMLGLPFVVRLLAAPAETAAQRHARLAESLGFGGWDRFRHMDWPALRLPAGTAAGLVAALSMGDLGVIALFGSTGTSTLPLELYARMGAYRTDEAAVLALLLVALGSALFITLERVIGGDALARRRAS